MVGIHHRTIHLVCFYIQWNCVVLRKQAQILGFAINRLSGVNNGGYSTKVEWFRRC